ncbi:hypothetical protein [Hymenobacter sp. APR13]|uniref:hypothetical protein n=1 Tax=Hymenobacter sp. APR13 TaxID=1356852 RepID=UPI0004E09F15|nr:hypothetical protein [Hymenobacter sp. APR13]AII52385.1 hypothetical protein N008_10400 [Hymenobacter sp. APR13]
MPTASTLSPDAYLIQHRPDLGLLVLRWLRPQSLYETQESYQQLLLLARQHTCAHWLLDGRRDGPLDVYTIHWLTQHFFPEAVRDLAPHPLCMAVLSSPARLQQLADDTSVAPVAHRALAPEQPYHTAVFLNEAEALAWLATQPA